MAFSQEEVVAAAAALFAARAYDSLSVDDLVRHLGVHRNSLYKTFGSKRGLYLAALRWYDAHELGPLIAGGGGPGDRRLDLLLLAAAERAPADPEVAGFVRDALARLDAALDGGTDRLLGARLRARLDG